MSTPVGVLNVSVNAAGSEVAARAHTHQHTRSGGSVSVFFAIKGDTLD